jgi:hypothetical protein
MPLLASLYNAEGAKPQVRYLEGLDGIETVRQIFEKVGGDFVQIFPIDDVLSSEEFIHGREKHMARMRHQESKEGVHARKLILVADTNPELLPQFGFGEARLISKKDFPVHGEITVRGNHVFLFSYKSAVLGCVIVSHEIAMAIRALFDLAWKGAQEYPSKHAQKK